MILSIFKSINCYFFKLGAADGDDDGIEEDFEISQAVTFNPKDRSELDRVPPCHWLRE